MKVNQEEPKQKTSTELFMEIKESQLRQLRRTEASLRQVERVTKEALEDNRKQQESL